MPHGLRKVAATQVAKPGADAFMLTPAEWWTITQQEDPYREGQTQINSLKSDRYATVENRNSPKIKNLIYETYKPFSVDN